MTGFSIELHNKHKHGELLGHDESDEEMPELLEEEPEEEVLEELADEVTDVVAPLVVEEVKKDVDDLDDEAEIAKLIKEEDITVVAEDIDVSEIDKLTGVPKVKGKSFCVSFGRLNLVLHSYAGPLHDHQHF